MESRLGRFIGLFGMIAGRNEAGNTFYVLRFCQDVENFCQNPQFAHFEDKMAQQFRSPACRHFRRIVSQIAHEKLPPHLRDLLGTGLDYLDGDQEKFELELTASNGITPAEITITRWGFAPEEPVSYNKLTFSAFSANRDLELRREILTPTFSADTIHFFEPGDARLPKLFGEAIALLKTVSKTAGAEKERTEKRLDTLHYLNSIPRK